MQKDSMKAAYMDGPESFVIKDCSLPVPADDEVLIKVYACSVCGSDLSLYKMGLQDRILGHELSGVIAETGKNVKGWKPGERVTVEPQLICGECHWCKTGKYNLCDSLRYSGLATDGGFAEYTVVPAYQLHRLPDTVSFEHGSLMEPLAVALRGIHRSGLSHGDTVAVFGCGAIGLFTILWAKTMGVKKIIATDIVNSRLEAVKSLTDDRFDPTACDIAEVIMERTEGIGADIVFECSGNNQAQINAIDSVRKSGTVMLLGIGYEPAELPLLQVTARELTLKGSLGYLSLADDGEFNQSIRAVSSGIIDLSTIPFGTYSLEETGKAFEDSFHGITPKAIVTITEDE